MSEIIVVVIVIARESVLYMRRSRGGNIGIVVFRKIENVIVIVVT